MFLRHANGVAKASAVGCLSHSEHTQSLRIEDIPVCECFLDTPMEEGQPEKASVVSCLSHSECAQALIIEDVPVFKCFFDMPMERQKQVWLVACLIVSAHGP